jgi:tRNA1Val (adenine37-N6)-methyltransferase
METTLDSILDIRVHQHREGYRFSMDSVLLYDFVDLKRAERIADFGAGSGVVGLLLAKKYPDARVTLVELQDSLYKLARKNVSLNEMAERVEVLKADIRELPAELARLDLVVSNPPFRKPGTGRMSPGQERAVARHELELTLSELVSAASACLKHRGRFSIIYHPERMLELIEELRAVRLEPKRLRFVHGNAESEAKMVLLDAVKGGRGGMKIERPLFVYNADGSYSDEVARIYGNSEPT